MGVLVLAASESIGGDRLRTLGRLERRLGAGEWLVSTERNVESLVSYMGLELSRHQGPRRARRH